jgi:hypothetical protein
MNTPKNLGYQNPDENLILYTLCATVIYTEGFFQLIAQLVFNAPTCFGYKLQPSSESYKFKRYVMRAIQVLKYKW